jgi:hypothetical protein
MRRVLVGTFDAVRQAAIVCGLVQVVGDFLQGLPYIEKSMNMNNAFIHFPKRFFPPWRQGL